MAPKTKMDEAETEDIILRNLYEQGITSHLYRSQRKDKGKERATVEEQQPSEASKPHASMASPRSHDDGGEVEEKFNVVQTVFSKENLINMDHNMTHMTIDLSPQDPEYHIFPVHNLAPLCIFRHLRSLTIRGMMQSYQSYIWLAVYMNSQLKELTLEMANEGESLDVQAMESAREEASSRPTMRQVAEGISSIRIPAKLPLVKLSLTNFDVDAAPFLLFDENTLQEIHLCRCQDMGFDLSERMHGRVKVTITD